MLRRHRRLAIASAVVAILIIAIAAGSNGANTGTSSPPPSAVSSVAGVTHGPTATAAATPKPTTLLSLKGDGIKTSPAFSVSQGDLNVSYTFDCRSFGSQGNFQLMLENAATGDMVDLLANALAASGKDSTTPTEPAGRYKIEVNSECSWTVTVTGR